MRFARSVLFLGLLSWGTSIRAQALGLSRDATPSTGPSFHIQAPGFVPVATFQTRGSLVSPAIVFEGRPLDTCPMPVAHEDSSVVDSMPVARGGSSEPMPVARSGCWNPLDQRP
jgi:hypothetical protein